MTMYTQTRTPFAKITVKRRWATRAVPPARKPGLVFRCKTTHSQYMARIEMLPQIPHLCTNPSIQDHTYTTRGRIHAIARARWVPSPHFLDKVGFLPCTPSLGLTDPREMLPRLTKLALVMVTQDHSRCLGKHLEKAASQCLSYHRISLLWFLVLWGRNVLAGLHCGP